jgi:hypothetical protein
MLVTWHSEPRNLHLILSKPDSWARVQSLRPYHLSGFGPSLDRSRDLNTRLKQGHKVFHELATRFASVLWERAEVPNTTYGCNGNLVRGLRRAATV